MPTWLSYVNLSLQAAARRPRPAHGRQVQSYRHLAADPPARIARRTKRKTQERCGSSAKQLELVDYLAELWKRAGFHLLHRPAAMHLHRRFGDADIVGNLFA